MVNVIRCRSWRPVSRPGLGHLDHMPQDCDACWRPCTARVERRNQRCADCEAALRVHPNDRVRYELVREPGLSRETLEILSSDMDPQVRSGAAYWLMVADLEAVTHAR